MSFLDTVKSALGKGKQSLDQQVEKYSDKIPDKIERAYDKASGAADKVIPGDDAQPEHEKIIKDD